MNYKELRNELLKRTERYANGVSNLYDDALKEIAKLMSVVDYDQTKPFSFESIGKFNKVDSIMQELEQNIQTAIEADIVKEFAKSYANASELLKEVLDETTASRVMNAFAPKVQSGSAARSYINSIADGSITASQRVWNGAVLGQMETAVQEGLMEGMPAARMATHLKQFLEEPDNYFRRFRIKTGESETGDSIYGRKWKKRYQLPDGSYKWKDADPKNYQSGMGIYHSSYKNAMRYARTSTNIAYRTADYERYQAFPFVVGIEIRTSNNHPDHDICDELAGKYPKDFKWTGWHPNCRCYQIPILSTEAETDAMVDDILDGGDGANVESSNAIEDMPDNFVKWSKKNADRLLESSERGTLPYFIKDNYRIIYYADESLRIPVDIYTMQQKMAKITDDYNNGMISVYEYVSKMQEERNIYSNQKTEYFKSIDLMIDSIRNRNHVIYEYSQSPAANRNLLKEVSHSYSSYADKFAERDVTFKTLFEAFKSSKDDSEKLHILHDMKLRAEQITIKDLESAGWTTGLTYVKRDFNIIVAEPISWSDTKGVLHSTKRRKSDLVIFKDKNGNEFAYPLGIDTSIGYPKASDVSEMIGSMSDMWQKLFDRITFMNIRNPQDQYWEFKYDIENLTSLATDSRSIHFWECSSNYSKDTIRRDIVHELSHSLENSGKVKNLTSDWAKAIEDDKHVCTIHNYISDYAKTNNAEDLAETFAYFVTGDDFTQKFIRERMPNRYKIIASVLGIR